MSSNKNLLTKISPFDGISIRISQSAQCCHYTWPDFGFPPIASLNIPRDSNML